ncbi:hypothetical protein [Flavobacterium pectinovorum]|uniref:hypothetical protein n=1 Tax=Flavobacterium pectinovorum TaxID=29533 RepID=UPI001FAE017E|nr:hypothetical protein [Flavobacterium pectinovorum]MCI9845168.1 hypothetical protein [Flavobacterium pectinovorum]
MKKRIIYLCLLVTLIFSCNPSEEEISNNINTISKVDNISEKDSIVVLNTTEIFPLKSLNTKTSKMSSYVYLSSDNHYTDKIIHPIESSTAFDLMLRIQKDGNLCCTKILRSSVYVENPAELSVIWYVFNYTHPLGSYQLVNESNGNVSIYNNYGQFNNICTWASSTEESDFNTQYLKLSTYRKFTVLGIANKRTFARLELFRRYNNGTEKHIKTFFNREIE